MFERTISIRIDLINNVRSNKKIKKNKINKIPRNE
jgi:hypothetical protein